MQSVRSHCRVGSRVCSSGLLASLAAALGLLVLTPSSALAGRGGVGTRSGATGSSAAGGRFVQGELLVRFRDGVASAQRASVLSALGGHVTHRLPLPGVDLVTLSGDSSVPRAAKVAERSRAVVYAEPNFIYHTDSPTPNDPLFGQHWGLDNTGQTVDPNGFPLSGTPDADIDAPEAWDLSTGSPTVKVAVVDT